MNYYLLLIGLLILLIISSSTFEKFSKLNQINKKLENINQEIKKKPKKEFIKKTNSIIKKTKNIKNKNKKKVKFLNLEIKEDENIRKSKELSGKGDNKVFVLPTTEQTKQQFENNFMVKQYIQF